MTLADTHHAMWVRANEPSTRVVTTKGKSRLGQRSELIVADTEARLHVERLMRIRLLI